MKLDQCDIRCGEGRISRRPSLRQHGSVRFNWRAILATRSTDGPNLDARARTSGPAVGQKVFDTRIRGKPRHRRWAQAIERVNRPGLLHDQVMLFFHGTSKRYLRPWGFIDRASGSLTRAIAICSCVVP